MNRRAKENRRVIMYRLGFVLLSMLAVLNQSEAIKCFECNSQIHPFCNDPFNNNTHPSQDCASLSSYDLTPKTHCRKIKHKVNNEWHIIRSCNKNDNMKLQDAQVYICASDSCNSAEILRPAIIVSVISAITLSFRLFH